MQMIMNASARTGMISIGFTMCDLILGAVAGARRLRPIGRPTKPLTCPPVRSPGCKIA